MTSIPGPHKPMTWEEWKAAIDAATAPPERRHEPHEGGLSARGLVDPEVADALDGFWRRYDPHQPRVPAGQPGGGRFGSKGGATGEGAVNKLIEAGCTDGTGQLKLSAASRKKIDAFVAKHEIDLAGIDRDMDRCFERPEMVEFGRTWYAKEFGGEAKRVAEEQGVSVEIATATIAIISARNRWRTDDGVPINANMAAGHIAHWKANPGMSAADLAETSPVGYLKQRGFGLNVYEMLTGEATINEAVTGTKRRSFYNNGSEPDTSWDVTNDVWQGTFAAAHSKLSLDQVQSMLSAEPPKYLMGEGVDASPMYVILTEAAMRAHVRHADRVGFTRPHQTQATTWGLAPELTRELKNKGS